MITIKVINLNPWFKFINLNINLQKGVCCMSLIASLLSSLGSMFASASSVACPSWWLDEPECPKSLIKQKNVEF